MTYTSNWDHQREDCLILLHRYTVVSQLKVQCVIVGKKFWSEEIIGLFGQTLSAVLHRVSSSCTESHSLTKANTSVLAFDAF